MPDQDSISQWLHQAKQGDRDAMGRICERYFAVLADFAKQRFDGFPRRAVDEEDAVISALENFRIGAESGDFNEISDRDDLWKVLGTLTSNKVIDHIRKLTAQKRGGGQVRGDSINRQEFDDDAGGFDRFPSDLVTPEVQLIVNEELQRMLDLLEDPVLIDTAVARMEGHSNKEIAELMGTSVSTIERRLRLERAIYSTYLACSN